MISRIARLKAKKGFTLIEAIVVIAIIGILIAIAVPALTYDNRPTRAKAMAKNVFYSVQDVMASMKSAAPDGLDGDSGITWYKSMETIAVYADFSGQGGVTGSGLITSNSGTKSSFDTLINAITDTDQKSKKVQVRRIYEKLRDNFANYSLSEDNMEGTLVAVCDRYFNVAAAYWFESDIVTALDGGTVFSDTYRLPSGYICASFPTEACIAGQTALEP